MPQELHQFVEAIVRSGTLSQEQTNALQDELRSDDAPPDSNTLAKRLVKEKKLTIPCLIDGIENTVATAYKALPDRLFVVNTDGKLVVAGKRGPWGLRPAMEEAQKWLASYRESRSQPTTSSGH